jgi:hypothetical protein
MATVTTTDDVALARKWAALYKLRGMQPLPSRMDEKRPFIRYSHLWNERAPDDMFERFETTNIQCMLGRYWRLLVVDLDGPEARVEFDRLAREEKSPLPPTWATHSGGGRVEGRGVPFGHREAVRRVAHHGAAVDPPEDGRAVSVPRPRPLAGPIAIARELPRLGARAEADREAAARIQPGHPARCTAAARRRGRDRPLSRGRRDRGNPRQALPGRVLGRPARVATPESRGMGRMPRRRA